MKKIIFLFAGLFLALLFAGCEKEPTLSKVPSVWGKVSQNTVPVGAEISLEWEASNTEVLTLNGKPVSLKDMMTVVILSDTSFLFEAQNGEEKIEEIFTVKAISSPVPAPTLKVSAVPTAIPYNGMSVVRISSTNADKIESDLPGFSGALDATFQTDKLKSTVTYHFKAIGKGGVAIDSITIEVLPITDEQLLCLSPWKMIKSEMAYSENGPWVGFIDLSEPCMEDNLYIFNKDYTFVFDQGLFLCEGVTNRYFYNTWSLSGHILGNTSTLIQLDSDTLVWVYQSIEFNPDNPDLSKKIWVKETFIHPN